MHNVRSAPIDHSSHKESAIVSRARLRRQRGAIERWTALVVLFVSFLGTIVALAGGWPAFIAALLALRPPVAALAGGLALQGLLTYLEWHYYDSPVISWGARAVDTALTAIGYGPLVIGGLTAALLARNVPESLYVAWGVVGLVSLLTAWYPESRLID